MTDQTSEGLAGIRLGRNSTNASAQCYLTWSLSAAADKDVLVREDTTDNHLYVIADGTLGVVRM
jgi:hypothetical protein